MAEFPEPDFDRDLAAHLRRESHISVPRLSQRVAQRVGQQRQRSQIIRWTSLATALAACFVVTFILQNDSTTVAPTVASHQTSLAAESSSESEWLTGASDLALIAPLVDHKNSIVSEVLTPTDI